MRICIIDTFSEFSEFWSKVRNLTFLEQAEAWSADYLKPWPELLHKQLDDYAGMQADWREIAVQRVFPFIEQRLPAMQAAHDLLLQICAPLGSRVHTMLGFNNPLVFVIYVGIGCGAGWATVYEDQPAVLLGLENIAEEGWHNRNALEGLIAHELGHLVHHLWRQEAGMPMGEGAWWQLYEEGFAQNCENVLLGRQSWHMAEGAAEKGWLKWCWENHAWLAAEFLRRVETGDAVRDFFGSWYDVRGYKQTGYFLGHTLIQYLEREMPIREIATLPDYVLRAARVLQQFAAEGGWRDDNRT